MIRQWLPVDKLKLLGEDKGNHAFRACCHLTINCSWIEDVDSTMLSGNSKVQRFKTTKIKEQCRSAWR